MVWLAETAPIMDTGAAPTFDASGPGASTVAAPGVTSGRIRPERVEVMLSSDRRRKHAPELRAQLVAEMMTGQVVVLELSRREGIGTSVLHRWHRQARRAADVPVPTAAQRLVPVRVVPPAPAEAARPAAGLEVVLGNDRVLRIPPGADPALVRRWRRCWSGSPGASRTRQRR